MKNFDDLTKVVRAQQQNQLALAAALEEIALWLDKNGGAAAARNVRDALSILDETQTKINLTLGKPL